MTNHNKRQPIPVINEAVSKHAWLVLFDYARRCGVGVDIHAKPETYHAEEMLRIWAASEHLTIVEDEVRPDVGNPYLNLKVCFATHGHSTLAGIVIYRVRELAKVEPMHCSRCHLPTSSEESEDGVCLACHDAWEREGADDLQHDDRGVYADGAEPDSNETLGLSQEFSR